MKFLTKDSVPCTIAVIPAAGQGARFGAKTPKQYRTLGETTVLEHTLCRFERAQAVKGVVLVVEAARVAWAGDTLTPRFAKLRWVVAGGETRQDSVACGVQAIDIPCDVVAIHDAARPLIPVALIDRCVTAAAAQGAAIVAAPARDTVKLVRDDTHIAETLPRRQIWLAQTPQAIRYPLLHQALEHAQGAGLVGTDEATLVEALGAPIHVIPGPWWNLKITTPEDLFLAEIVLSRYSEFARAGGWQ